MSKTKPKLLIIDGNALIHRSFHALPPSMSTKDGEVVNAVYGFTTVLLKAIKEFKPEYLVLTLDKKGPTFRHKEFEDYKATRVKAPDELYAQIPRVKEVAGVFDIPIYEKDGFEADDLIGTISRSVNSDIDKIIVTGDMDTMQLVNEHTKVYTMSRGLLDSVVYDEDKVKERYDLSVAQMIDYKALRGDPSDNIPGVKGVGEKTATEILKNFHTLDNLYNYLEGKIEKVDNEILNKVTHPAHPGTPPKEGNIISDRIKNLLLEHKKDAYMSQSLATIKCDVPIKFDLEAARFHQFDTAKVTKLFSELEFKSLLPRIKDIVFDKDVSKVEIDKFARNQGEFKYVLVDTETKFKKFLAELKKQKVFTFDTETTGIDPLSSDLLGISFSWKEGEAFFVILNGAKRNEESRSANQRSFANAQDDKQGSLFNYNKERATRNAQLATHKFLDELKPIFEDEKVKKWAHNMKFDMRVIGSYGIKVKGIELDTMLASYILNPGSRQHNLDGLVFSELGFEKISKADLLGKGRDKIAFSEVKTEKLANYSCEDADFTFRLGKKLKKSIKDKHFEDLFYKLELPLVEVLAEMENNGIRLDIEFLKKFGNKVHKEIELLEKKIHKLAGTDFNIGSPKQLKEVLFEKLEIATEGIGKTKTGFSTAAEELEKLKDHHEIIPLIQEYRELTKLANTYIDTLPALVNPATKRVHTSFNQAVAATGRLSSTDPNLQNIPIRTELGREIRKAFVADPGYKLVSLDYSQIELRVAAHMSGDPKMIKAFKDGIDIHTATAAEINQVKLDEVTPKMRREAKAINFGILYGQGPHGLSQTADIPYVRAREFIDNYFKVYSKVKEYLNKTIDEAHKHEYVETLFGRRRFLPEVNSSVTVVRKSAERMAINTPIQGTAADMMKKAMINVYEKLMSSKQFSDGGVKMLLTVHDELLFEIKEDLIDGAVTELKKIMENVLKLQVPIKVESKAGINWGDLEEIK